MYFNFDHLTHFRYQQTGSYFERYRSGATNGGTNGYTDSSAGGTSSAYGTYGTSNAQSTTGTGPAEPEPEPQPAPQQEEKPQPEFTFESADGRNVEDIMKYVQYEISANQI